MKKKRLSARNKQYWLDRGYSEEDAILEAKKRTPFLYEYFRYFKNMTDEESKEAVLNSKNLKAITKENMIKKYGEEEGLKKWEIYRYKQSYSNTLPYFIEKYGEEEGTKKYKSANRGRAITKENMVKKHGEEKGLKKWDTYIERQRYTTSKEYFIEKYGEEGLKKWEKFRFLRGHSYESYLERCNGDVELALKKMKEFYTKINYYYSVSKVSQVLFNKINIVLLKLGYEKIFYDSYSEEWYFTIKDFGYTKVDFFLKEKGKIIEFYGDFWHCNPKKYKSGEKVNFRGEDKILVDDIWKKDKIRLEYIKKIPYVKDILIIWEDEFTNKPEETVEKCLKFLIE